MIRTTSRVDQRYDGAGPGRSMLAFRSVVSVLVSFVMLLFVVKWWLG